MTFQQRHFSKKMDPRRWSLTGLNRAWLPGTLFLLSIILMGTETALFTYQHPNIRLSFNSDESDFVLDGFHKAEEDARSSYRWTAGKSQIRLVQFGQGSTLVLSLKLGPAPPIHAPTSFTLDYDGAHAVDVFADGKPRSYAFLVPPDSFRFNSLIVNVESETTVVPPDTRHVGLRVEAATLSFIGARFAGPSPALLVVQILFLAICALFLHRLSFHPLVNIGILSGMMLLLLVLYDRHILLAYVYLVRLLIAAGFLTLLTYLLLPVAERYAGWIACPSHMRVLWGITFLACMIRLVGSLYPIFYAYDLSLNVGRLLKTILGTLVVTNNSIEFRNGVTVYPPGPYLILLPGMLARIPPNLLVQGGIALIDGVGALTVAAMARVLGTSHRTAVFSALLYAALPINFTALWWGLSAQIFGQALMLPLMCALVVAMRPRDCTNPRTNALAWLTVLILLSMSFLSHIGVAILAGAWLGLAWIVLRVRQTLEPDVWWTFTVKFVISCLMGIALIYSTVAVMMVDQALAVGNKVATSDYVPAYWLMYRGFQIAFHEMGFWLLVPGLWLLWRRNLPRGGMELIGSWLGVVALFWAIEMMSALQVRYIYFLAPLACVGLGLLLDRLALRGQVARVVAWSVVAVLLIQGSIYWYVGTFKGLMMSVTPLLR
jgi:hypothetical protein